MYDRSVWLDEVDKGLFDLITATVYYKDSENKLIPVTPTFPLNFSDVNELELPTVIIKHLGEKFDNYRYDHNNAKVITSYDIENGRAVLEDLAKPYTLQYQLDFLSEYKEDMNYMLRTWHGKIPERFLLPCHTSEGIPMLCYMHLVKPPTTLNHQKGDIKVHRTILLYDIKVELDMGTSTISPIATSINLDIDN